MKLITVVILYFCIILNNVLSVTENRFKRSDTPLFLAAEKGEFDIVKTLIENGADVNAGNSRRWTPLHVASKNGHITIVRLLIENGANVDATTNLGWTPLHLASRIDNDNSMIQLSFNITDGQAWFDANSATCDSPVEGIPNLCDTFVRIKIDGEQVYETKEEDNTGHPIFNEIFQTGLISADAIITFEMWDSDVGYSENDIMSTWNGNAEYYLTRHLLVDNITDGTNRNSLSVSTELVMDDKLDDRNAVAKILLENDANVNAEDNNKDSPLHSAVRNANEELVVLLFQYGAKRNAKNRDEVSSHDIARRTENTRIRDLFEQTMLQNVRNACEYETTEQRIFNGELAKDGEFPWMAALGYVSERDYRVTFDCGGTIITNLFVLTAAHCAAVRQPSIVRMGKKSLNDADGEDELKTVNRRIEQIISHPKYSHLTKINDIALLRLNKAISFSNHVKPACLQTDARDLPSNVELLVTGWGIVSIHTHHRSSDLRKAQLMTMPLSQCNTTLMDWGIPRRDPALRNGLIAGQYCAYDPQGRNDSCQGDSGGPLQYFPTSGPPVATVLGIVSFGIGCGSSRPSVYTRVAHYLNWIDEKVWPEL